MDSNYRLVRVHKKICTYALKFHTICSLISQIIYLIKLLTDDRQTDRQTDRRTEMGDLFFHMLHMKRRTNITVAFPQICKNTYMKHAVSNNKVELISDKTRNKQHTNTSF